MRQSSAVFATVVAAVLSLAACSSDDHQPGKNPSAKKHADSGDAVDAKLTQKAKAPQRGGGVEEQTPTDDNTGKDGTTTEPTDTTTTTTADPGNAGKGDVTQTPTQTPPPGKPVEVDVPKVPCVYLDESKPDYTIAKNQFGPNLPPVAVPSSIIKGDLQADGETFIGSFTIFQVITGAGPIDSYMMQWDNVTAAIPFDFAMVVTHAADSTCKAYLKFVRQEVRLPHGGCFAQDTKIRMADGTDQVIAMISEGDFVMNPVTRRAVRVAEVRKGPEKTPLYEIAFAGHRMLVTDNHPVPVKGGLKQARQVTTNDYVYDENGILNRVVAAHALPLNPKQIVVNVRLEASSDVATEHMVLADGVLSGDLFLQRQLAKTKTLAAKK